MGWMISRTCHTNKPQPCHSCSGGSCCSDHVTLPRNSSYLGKASASFFENWAIDS